MPSMPKDAARDRRMDDDFFCGVSCFSARPFRGGMANGPHGIEIGNAAFRSDLSTRRYDD